MKLVEARRTRGFTLQSDLEKKSTVATVNIRNIERGRRQPTFNMVRKLCEALQLDASEIEEFQGVERAGDPCPCNCGGIKVLPDSAHSRVLWISLRCSICNKERNYKTSAQKHMQVCKDCGSRRRTWKSRAVPYEPGQAFHTAFVEALDRKGLTQQQAAVLAGLSPRSIPGWISGRVTPLLHSLQALADVLDTPNLTTVIPSRVSVIQMHCEHCGDIKEYYAHIIRGDIKRGMFKGAVVDYVTGTGRYPECYPSAMSSHGKREYRRRTQKLGKAKYNAKLAEPLLRALANRSDEQKAAALAKMHAAVRGSHKTEAQILASAAGQMTPTVSGKFGTCRICRLRTYTTEKNRAETHAVCLNQYKREHQTGKFVRSSPPPYPPRPKGYAYSAEYLALSFELCVRHLLWDDPTDTVPDSPKGDGLAIKLGVDPRSISDRIKVFIETLPPDGTGGQRLNFWKKAFQKAAREKYHYKI